MEPTMTQELDQIDSYKIPAKYALDTDSEDDQPDAAKVKLKCQTTN